MSILLKGNDSINSLPKAPIANVSNVTFIDNKKGSVTIKYTDPNDFILQNVPLVEWSKTVCVYSTSNNINSIEDGTKLFESTIRNQYKDNGINVNINPDTLYYFKFFTINKRGIVNESGTIHSFTSKGVSTTLKDNDWATIIEVANKGEAQNYWKIGDEIDLVLSGNFNETVTLQIWDFNHFDKSDGTGKAGICFGMKHLMKNYQQMNSSNTNSGGWNTTNMKYTVMNNIFNSMPRELQNAIKEVKTEANRGGNSSSSQACADKIFLPGFKELGFTYENYDGNQVKFPIFSDNNSRIKKMNNGSGQVSSWWTRSPGYYVSGYYFRTVHTDGDSNGYTAAYSCGVCFCFNI